MESQDNEGEGNRTAAREYNKGVQDFVKTGQVKKKAREAADALDGPEATELRQAEEAGKKHSHGEDPALKKGAKEVETIKQQQHTGNHDRPGQERAGNEELGGTRAGKENVEHDK